MLVLPTSQFLRSPRHQHGSGSNIARLCFRLETPTYGVGHVPILNSLNRTRWIGKNHEPIFLIVTNDNKGEMNCMQFNTDYRCMLRQRCFLHNSLTDGCWSNSICRLRAFWKQLGEIYILLLCKAIKLILICGTVCIFLGKYTHVTVYLRGTYTLCGCICIKYSIREIRTDVIHWHGQLADQQIGVDRDCFWHALVTYK